MKVLAWLGAIVAVLIALLGGCAALVTWSMQEHGRTDLHAAAENNDVAVIRDWIARGKALDPDMQYASTIEHAGDKGVTPLMLAARMGHQAAALLLIEGGARVDARSHSPSFPEYGDTVLESAIDGGNPAIVRAVLDKLGNDVPARERKDLQGRAVYHVCDDRFADPGSADEPRLEVARLVLARIPPATPADARLAEATQDPRCTAIIDLALDHGIEASPAMLVTAARTGDERVARRLIGLGVDVKATASTRYASAGVTTPLLVALHWKQHAMVDLLLGAGADPNVAGEDGTTPLHLVLGDFRRDSAGLINRLIAAGARTDIPDAKGKTAADLAEGRFSARVGYGLTPQARKALHIPDYVPGGTHGVDSPASFGIEGCNACPVTRKDGARN